jgi:hypothetical protein
MMTAFAPAVAGAVKLGVYRGHTAVRPRKVAALNGGHAAPRQLNGWAGSGIASQRIERL